MNFEQYQYTVAGFRAIEVYPFTKMTKRNFRGYRQNAPDQVYRLVVYPYNLVKPQALIATLLKLKTIKHNVHSKIIHLFQETQLIKVGEKPQKEKVIAVVLQDNLNQQYISLVHFIVQVGNISEKFARDITFQFLSFLKLMNDKGFINSFDPKDIFFEKSKGKIRFDNYGDSCHFLKKQETGTDIWELGTLLFSLLKGSPPYQNRLPNDIHYNCLNKGQFQKFWSIIHEKTVKNPSMNCCNFLNKCFESKTTIVNLQQHLWFQNFVELTEQQRIGQISSLFQKKQQRMQQQSTKKHKLKEKMAQAARERDCLSHKRGTQNVQIQIFLDYLFAEQETDRKVNKNFSSQDQKQKSIFQIAHFLTLLKLNQNKDITIFEIKDKKDTIIFKIKSEIGCIVNFDAQVQVALERQKDSIKFTCQRIEGAQFYESLWINNFIEELIQQI